MQGCGPGRRRFLVACWEGETGVCIVPRASKRQKSKKSMYSRGDCRQSAVTRAVEQDPRQSLDRGGRCTTSGSARLILARGGGAGGGMSRVRAGSDANV